MNFLQQMLLKASLKMQPPPKAQTPFRPLPAGYQAKVFELGGLPGPTEPEDPQMAAVITALTGHPLLKLLPLEKATMQENLDLLDQLLGRFPIEGRPKGKSAEWALRQQPQRLGGPPPKGKGKKVTRLTRPEGSQ